VCCTSKPRSEFSCFPSNQFVLVLWIQYTFLSHLIVHVKSGTKFIWSFRKKKFIWSSMPS
jgi:hypothetical protein